MARGGGGAGGRSLNYFFDTHTRASVNSLSNYLGSLLGLENYFGEAEPVGSKEGPPRRHSEY